MSFFTPKPEKVTEIERVWALRREAVKLLDYVVSEWKSDPTSVQCFDLRKVEQATKVIAELKKADVFGGEF